MALNLEKYRKGDFEFTTSTLGLIRCRFLKQSEEAEFCELARSMATDGLSFARSLLQRIAYKKIEQPGTHDDDTVPLNEQETAGLSDDELNHFSKLYRKLRLQISPDEIASAENDAEHFDYDILPRTFIEHFETRRAEIAEIAKKFTAGFSGSILQQALKAANLGSDIKHDFDRFKNLGGDSISKAVDALDRQNLGTKAINAAVERMNASDRLGESIAMWKYVPDIPASTARNFVVPKNPLIELTIRTNELLEQRLNHATKTSEVLVSSANLLQTMASEARAAQEFTNASSKKAEKLATIAIVLTLIGTVISIFVGGASIYLARHYGEISPTELSLNLHLHELADIAKKDREMLAAQAEKDRALWMQSRKH